MSKRHQAPFDLPATEISGNKRSRLYMPCVAPPQILPRYLGIGGYSLHRPPAVNDYNSIKPEKIVISS